MNYLPYSLTSDEAQAFVHVAETAIAVRTSAEFKALINGPVKRYFPHEKMLAVLGYFSGVEIRTRYLISINHPDDYLKKLQRIGRAEEQQVVQHWLSQRRPQIINPEDMEKRLSPVEFDLAEYFGITNRAAFGWLDIEERSGTYFSFSQIPGRLDGRHEFKLELLVPVLHAAFVRVFRHQGDRVSPPIHLEKRLTKRELQILSLLASGLSNRVIAERLSRSESTVQNHVHAIFKKLGVNSRSAAVAYCRSQALESGNDAAASRSGGDRRRGEGPGGKRVFNRRPEPSLKTSLS